MEPSVLPSQGDAIFLQKSADLKIILPIEGAAYNHVDVNGGSLMSKITSYYMMVHSLLIPRIYA